MGSAEEAPILSSKVLSIWNSILGEVLDKCRFPVETMCDLGIGFYLLLTLVGYILLRRVFDPVWIEQLDHVELQENH